MPWIEISLRVRREAVDEAEAALVRHGALAITLLDDADRP
ncbi:MAG: 50S ribosomal protein L11 methyltransferase, partial [Xanthomonadales bacterium]|nr:50S ribosomal protein L11 methyltransferase [Xanthomonadales bacterium]